MIVDIGKIIIKNRIRKDFGDIQELADDIKQNGLINPPVVNKEYELLAGERRLRACKSLGWSQIEIRMMDTRDAEHELNVEISENDVRKGFTKSERVDYMKRLLRIEQAKSREISNQNLKQNADTDSQKSDSRGRADETTAEQFGVSRDTLRKEIHIVDNKDLLNQADFAEWDEGKLSTNKAFQKVKEKQKEIEAENNRLRSALSESEAKRIKAEQSTKEVVKEVVKEVEVVPEDYAELQTRAKYAESYEKDYRIIKNKYDKIQGKLSETEKENQSLKERIEAPDFEKVENRRRSALFFAAGTKDYIERFGGYVWLTNEVKNMDKSEREDFLWCVHALEGFVFRLKENLSDV